MRKDNIVKVLSYIRVSDFYNPMNLIETTDFLYAPLTAQYEYSYTGGLADFCYNLFKNMCCMNESMNMNIPIESIAKVAVGYCIPKVGLYGKEAKNVKVYCENGDKSDSNGQYEWRTEYVYAPKEPEERFTTGSDFISSFMWLQYLQYSQDEMFALAHCNDVSTKIYSKDISFICKRYPLVSLLHCGIIMALNIDSTKEVTE